MEKKSNVGKRLLTDDQAGDDEEPPRKMQLILPAGQINTKLGLVIGDRVTTQSE